MIDQLRLHRGTKGAVPGPAAKHNHSWRPGLSIYLKATIVILAALFALAI